MYIYIYVSTGFQAAKVVQDFLHQQDYYTCQKICPPIAGCEPQSSLGLDMGLWMSIVHVERMGTTLHGQTMRISTAKFR